MKTFRLYFAIFILAIITISCGEDSIEYNNNTVENCYCFEESAIVNHTLLDKVIKKHLEQRNLPTTIGYDVTPIKNNDGFTYLYAVNFDRNNGFVIISANKHFEPILAFSDDGSFDVMQINRIPGLQIWTEQIFNQIDSIEVESQRSDLKYKMLWSSYEEHETQLPRLKASTRSLEDDPDYIMMHHIEYCTNNEYQWIHLEQENWTTDDPTIDQIVNDLAHGNVYPVYEDNWRHYCILAYKDVYTSYDTPNFVQSQWDQEMGYNMSFPSIGSLDHAYTGCAILAVGQTMRYFEKPTYSDSFPYNLSSMPYDVATRQTSNFLLSVFNRFTNKEVTDSGTASNLNESYNVLRSYGYTASIGNMDIYALRRNIAMNKPVIIRGQTGQLGDPDYLGHQWLVTGCKRTMYHREYMLHVFTTETELTKVWEYSTDPIATTEYYYMNWGWGGWNNGYFNLTTMEFPQSEERITNLRIIYDISY